MISQTPEQQQLYDARLKFQLAEFARIVPHHLAVHEHDGVQGLILCRSGSAAIYRQMRQECPHLGRPHFPRVPFIVKQDEPLDPGDVGLLGSIRQMLHAAGVRHLIEEPGFVRFTRLRRHGDHLSRVAVGL